MSSNLRLDSINDALTRAHRAARFGSEAARTGAMGQETAYVGRLLARAQQSASVWANWEAINDQFASQGSAAGSLVWLGLDSIGPIRMALARDSLLAAFSLSDQVQNNRLTLCMISRWLAEPGTAQRLATEQWVLDQGYAPDLANWGALENAERISKFSSLVVTDWKKEVPIDTEFAQLRTTLRPMRDRLAHSLDVEIAHAPTIDEVRRFIALTLELSTDAALIWIGSAVDASSYRHTVAAKAKRFWQHAFAQPPAPMHADADPV